MRGVGEKIANFTAVLPVFPERFVMSYLIYVNDSQNAWTTSSLFSYTVTDMPPLIAFVNYSPSSPRDSDGVTISVNVTDGTAVQTVTLYYSFGGAFVSVEMVQIAGNLYQGQVPAYPGSFSFFHFQSVPSE